MRSIAVYAPGFGNRRSVIQAFFTKLRNRLVRGKLPRFLTERVDNIINSRDTYRGHPVFYVVLNGYYQPSEDLEDVETCLQELSLEMRPQ